MGFNHYIPLLQLDTMNTKAISSRGSSRASMTTVNQPVSMRKRPSVGKVFINNNWLISLFDDIGSVSYCSSFVYNLIDKPVRWEGKTFKPSRVYRNTLGLWMIWKTYLISVVVLYSSRALVSCIGYQSWCLSIIISSHNPSSWLSRRFVSRSRDNAHQLCLVGSLRRAPCRDYQQHMSSLYTIINRLSGL